MKIALVIIAVLFLIFALLLFTPIYFVINFSKTKDGSKFTSSIKYLFLRFSVKRKTSKKEKQQKEKRDDSKVEELPQKIEKGIELFKYIEDDVVDILHYFSEKVIKIRKFNFFIHFGFSDPMHTGITTGALYGVIYNILSVFNNIFTIEECDVKINPDFERKHLDISSECILKVKSVHIINMAFKVLKMYFKIVKINKKKGSFKNV